MIPIPIVRLSRDSREGIFGSSGIAVWVAVIVAVLVGLVGRGVEVGLGVLVGGFDVSVIVGEIVGVNEACTRSSCPA